MTRNPLLEYLPFIARDAALKSLAPLGLFFLLCMVPLLSAAGSASLAEFREGGESADAAIQTYRQFIGMVITLGAVLAMSGVVAMDREKNYIRFFFASPIAPWRYYLGQFVVRGVLLVLGTALIPVLFGLVFVPVSVMPVVQSTSLLYLIYGGFLMLCGAMVNRDGILFIIVLISTMVAQQLAQVTASVPLKLSYLLPPFVLVERTRGLLIGGESVPTADLGLLTGYGLLTVVAALVIIRSRNLVR